MSDTPRSPVARFSSWLSRIDFNPALLLDGEEATFPSVRVPAGRTGTQ